MKIKYLHYVGLVLLLFAAACRPAAPTVTQAAPTVTTSEATPAAVDPTAVPSIEPTLEVTEEPEPTAPPTPAWADPVEPYEGVIQVPASEGQVRTGVLLDTLEYPEGDYEADLISHGKLDAPVTGYAETENELLIAAGPVEPIPLNTKKTFWISNTDLDTIAEVEFQLLGISDHAYFWFDTDRNPDPGQVQAAKDGFEAIVADIQSVFGAEHPLGIDGDSRIFILHPAATKVCNVTEDTAHQCGLLGYFWGINQFPTDIFWFSNVHEGLIMNFDGMVLGGENYLDTLAHEYRHLVEYWYRDFTETWEAEGQAVMAEDLLGFRGSNLGFANTYLSDPDVQLNSWTQGSTSRTIFHYGYGYVFSRYIYDRFGAEFFALWAKYEKGGFPGLTALFAEQGQDVDATQVWLDFLASLVLFNKAGAEQPYTFAPDFAAAVDPVKTTNIPAPPRSVEGEVRQYGADIYRLLSDQDFSITFTGSTLNSLLGRMPPSGEHFWYAGRALSGLRTLTLEADLTGVDTATLQYETYFKLSRAFGFAYVVVSTDGGVTWQQLVTENMKGEKESDDPYDFALTDRFYTSNSPGGGWVQETIDLTPYAGQTILIRWETDSGDRDPGFAIDNVAIPEIGFYDDAESEVENWVSEGWIRATAYIPQNYYLTLVTFVDGAPVLTSIELDELNTATFDVASLSGGEAFLIVAATAPQSQQPTAYRIETSGK